MNKMKPITAKPRAVILAALAALVAAVLVMIWAGQQLTGLSGATDLAEDAQGQVWLALHGDLVQLSATGVLQERFDLKALGIDTANTIVPMPRGNLWVGSLKHERLILLSPYGQKLAQARPPPSAGPIYGTFHAAYEPTTDRLVVADTQNHRLLSFTGKGVFVGTSAPSLDLRFPNDLAADGHGGLLLANTNLNAIMALNPDLAQTYQTAMPQSRTVNVGGVQRHYIWPVWVSVAPDGDRYISWHDSDLLRGDVLAYAADGHFLHALPLEPNAQPQGLLARKNDVLVAVKQEQTFKLLHFDRQGHALGPFGNAALQTQLAAVSTRAVLMSRLQQGARALVILCALGLLIVALWIRRQQGQPSHVVSKDDLVQLKAQTSKPSLPTLIAAVGGIIALLLALQFSAFDAS